VVGRHGWGWMWFGGIFGIVAAGGYYFRRGLGHKEVNRARRTGRDAVGILRERYARGEITKEEFERMKKDLS